MSPLILATIVLTATPATQVGVLMADGSAQSTDRAALTQALVEAIRGFAGLEVLDLSDPAKLLGSGRAASLDQCDDDGCRMRALQSLGITRLLISTFDGTVFRARILAATEDDGARTVLVASGRLSSNLRDLAGQMAADLFADQAGQGQLEIISHPAGAQVSLDGAPRGPTPFGPSPVAAGSHRVLVEAPRHHPFEQEVLVELGRTRTLDISLAKNRGTLAWILAGTAAAVALVGVGLGAAAQHRANGWDDACASGGCAPGFTRARFDDDDRFVTVASGTANGFYGLSGGLAIGALVAYLVDPGAEVEP